MKLICSSGSSRGITMNIRQSELKIFCQKILYRFCLKWLYPSKYKGNHKFHMKFKVKFFLVFCWRLQELSKMVLIMLNTFLILGILVRLVFQQLCIKHGIELVRDFTTWNWKYCGSSCCRAITINTRQSEQKILYLNIQCHFA